MASTETRICDARAALVSFFAALVLGAALLFAAPRQARPPQRGSSANSYRPFVYVSAISITPVEIHQSRVAKPPVAILTIQIFHQALSTPQTVTLEVGTYSVNPSAGVSVVYKPPNQTVRLPPGPAKYAVATAEVERVDIGKYATAAVVIAASLANPSPGIRVAPSLAPQAYRVVLKINNP